MAINNSLLQAIALEFSKFPQVIAITLAGSQTANLADNLSEFVVLLIRLATKVSLVKLIS
ncbi:MAG: hypothetical protein SAK29_29120 [Scytonema sp. PMC 1069.18]|nr:hypothetical protein [Scytonema sp. PMC 1069.18]MEC4881030.1 hypothetical protein [Scytonema sp. PMC 1070.18]